MKSRSSSAQNGKRVLLENTRAHARVAVPSIVRKDHIFVIRQQLDNGRAVLQKRSLVAPVELRVLARLGKFYRNLVQVAPRIDEQQVLESWMLKRRPHILCRLVDFIGDARQATPLL